LALPLRLLLLIGPCLQLTTLFPYTTLFRSSLWSINTVTVGVTVSTTKLPVLPLVPAFPLPSCQLLSTLTEPLLMSMPFLAVKVTEQTGTRLQSFHNLPPFAVSFARLKSLSP